MSDTNESATGRRCTLIVPAELGHAVSVRSAILHTESSITFLQRRQLITCQGGAKFARLLGSLNSGAPLAHPRRVQGQQLAQASALTQLRSAVCQKE